MGRAAGWAARLGPARSAFRGVERCRAAEAAALESG